MILGERIRKLRIKKQLSQGELGEMLGVSKVSVCGYELGTRTPSLSTLIKIIEILDISADELLGRDVNVVSEDDPKYHMKLAREEITIIQEIKKHPELYSKLIKEPNRTIELISRKLNK